MYFICFGFVSGQAGQKGVNKVLEMTGRKSFVILLLGSIIAVACISMTGTGIYKVVDKLTNGYTVEDLTLSFTTCDFKYVLLSCFVHALLRFLTRNMRRQVWALDIFDFPLVEVLLPSPHRATRPPSSFHGSVGSLTTTDARRSPCTHLSNPMQQQPPPVPRQHAPSKRQTTNRQLFPAPSKRQTTNRPLFPFSCFH